MSETQGTDHVPAKPVQGSSAVPAGKPVGRRATPPSALGEPMADLLPGGDVRYVGRKASASPATGSKRGHKAEQEQLISEAIGPLDKEDDKKAEASGPKLVRASA